MSWFKSPKGIGYARALLDERYVKDFQDIAKLGYGHIRLPFTHNPSTKAIKFALELGLQVVVDHHPVIPFVSEDEIFEVAAKWRKWATIVRDFPNDSVAVEVLNEPRMRLRGAIWDSVLNLSIQGIREISPNRTIVVTNRFVADPDYFDGPWFFEPPKFNNLVVSLNYWRPYKITHGGYIVGLPIVKPGEGSDFDRADFKNMSLHLQRYADYVQKKSVDNCVTEFGCWETNPNRLIWFEQVAKNLQKLKLNWCAWDYEGRFYVRKDQTDGAAIQKLFLG